MDIIAYPTVYPKNVYAKIFSHEDELLYQVLIPLASALDWEKNILTAKGKLRAWASSEAKYLFEKFEKKLNALPHDLHNEAERMAARLKAQF